jgi:hypothetical protein
MEVIGSGKPSSLIPYGNNYCCKKFYSTGPRRTDGHMDRWTDGQMDRWTDGQRDRGTEGQMEKVLRFEILPSTIRKVTSYKLHVTSAKIQVTIYKL